MNNSLNNISPIDGRYAKLTKELNCYFSESALIKYRVFIEIEYFQHLVKLNLPELQKIQTKKLDQILRISSEIHSRNIDRIKKN